ncbi:hypothetical protein ABIA33_004981 [Streptacidiphilus sp. MAP12-16]
MALGNGCCHPVLASRQERREELGMVWSTHEVA